MPDTRLTQQELKQLAYMSGYWASTKLVLNAAGIQHITFTEPLATGCCRLTFSDDAKL